MRANQKRISDTLWAIINMDVLELILYLKKKSIDINEGNNGSGYTLLTYIIDKQPFHFSFVSTLLAAGASINALDGHKRTALHYAVKNANRDLIGKLINLGADVNIQDKKGNTPLMYAAGIYSENLATNCIEVLISRGANTKIYNNLNQTALGIAQSRKKHILCTSTLNLLAVNYIDTASPSMI